MDRCFDQLSQCPGAELELRSLRGRSLGRGERPVVAAKAVEKDCADPLGPLDAEPSLRGYRGFPRVEFRR